MSYQAVDWAMQQSAGDATAKAVLLALAWSLNAQTGLCCPSLAFLANKIEVKQRHTVLNAVIRLEKLGLITRTVIQPKPGEIGKTVYSFPALSDLKPVTSEVTAPVTSNDTGCYLKPLGVLPQTTQGVTSNDKGCYLKPLGVLPQTTHNKEENKEENREQLQLAGDACEESERNTKERPKIKHASSPKTQPFDIDVLPEDWGTYCRQIRPDLDPETVFAAFSGYYRIGKGKDTLRSDKGWNQAWLNWVKREREAKPQAKRPSSPETFDESYYKGSVNPDGTFNWG